MLGNWSLQLSLLSGYGVSPDSQGRTVGSIPAGGLKFHFSKLLQVTVGLKLYIHFIKLYINIYKKHATKSIKSFSGRADTFLSLLHATHSVNLPRGEKLQEYC